MGSHCGVRPSHYGHDGAIWDLQQQQHRGGCVVGVVQSAFRYADPFQQPFLFCVVGARVEWAACRGGERLARFLPEFRCGLPLALLLCIVLLEQAHQLVW